MWRKSFDRRDFLRRAAELGFAGSLAASLVRPARANPTPLAKRVVFFYFPDGVAGPSQDGEPSLWHPTGSERSFSLSEQLEPLLPHKSDCVFFRGLSLGPTDSGSHPGGAKKLLTAVDGGNGESIDHLLARTLGASSPHRHVYLGAMATHNSASGDKYISYPTAGQSSAPEDDPLRAFDRLFGATSGAGDPSRGGGSRGADPRASVIDSVIEELRGLQQRLGEVERRKLDLHLESLREVERRIKTGAGSSRSCESPETPATQFGAHGLHDPARFPEVLRLQSDLLVEAFACGLTRVGVIQASHHTSELIMSRFPGSEMHDPGFDMRSHQASHYGARHDRSRRELNDYLKQRRWFVAEFAHLLDRLKSIPEEDGTMLDSTIAVLVTEVCDGNTHLHDDMPIVLAGRGGGTIETGRLLDFGYARHGGLWAAIANASGIGIPSFGDAHTAALAGVLR
jgi:hypothetical protein